MINPVCVKISGLNLLRIINRLVEKNVYINNLKIKPKIISFVIDESNLDILNKICKIEHKFYKIIYKNGLKQFIFRLPYMFGAILAFAIFFAYFFAINMFIKNINVTYSSNFEYDLFQVNNLLRQNGIVCGMRKNAFSVSDIQKLILLEVDSVEGCEVRLNGNNLNICIYPATMKYEVSKDNLISKYDGIVTFAEAYSGELKIKVGDTIKKGDLLIKNNNGASGKILAKVYFTSTKIYNENRQEIIYTGKEYVIKDFVINQKFKINGKNYCNFDKFLVEKCDFWVSKNLFLAIFCQKTTYKEIEIIEKQISFEDVKENIKQELFEETKSKFNSDSEITNVTYSIVSEGSYTRVDCFVETIIDLCK